MNDTKQILKKYGLLPENSLNDTIANGRNFPGDYRGKSIKRLKLNNCSFTGAKFNDAAVTGSMFFGCSFEKCSMDQGDFEYCDFSQCDITSKKPISIAFDNSNFIGTKIHDLIFYSSTFTNAFFDETELCNVIIKNCTLENATFQHCRFLNIDLSQLNLDFVEFKDPYFENTTLPITQIPYTFGLIQYLMVTTDNVYLLGKNGRVTPSEYVNDALPALLQSYLDMDEKEEVCKVYFPLINILLALGKMERAEFYFTKALNLSASIQDFRMIKHYCKLMSLNENYTYKQKKAVYQKICNNFRQDLMPPWQLKDYSRNIGDIKYILLIENNLPMLVFNFVANVFHSNIEAIGMTLKHIFKLSDRYTTSAKHDIRIEISRNSPIMVTVQFIESIENIISFLNDLILLTCFTVCSNVLQIKEDIYGLRQLTEQQHVDDSLIISCLREYEQAGLQLSIMDYHIENWREEYSKYFYALPDYKNQLLATGGILA